MAGKFYVLVILQPLEQYILWHFYIEFPILNFKQNGRSFQIYETSNNIYENKYKLPLPNQTNIFE